MAVPLDQYLAEDGNDQDLLTETPQEIFQKIKEEQEKYQQEKLSEPSNKKIKVEDGEFLDEKKPVKEEEIEEGELEDGEVPDDDGAYVEVPVVNPIIKAEEEERKKKKVALLLSYCGAKYHGMQKNPDVETIELKLLQALVKIGSIPEMHMQYYLDDNVNQLSFQRAARTDKGVSAVRQVASLKLIANDNFIEELNQALPKDIRSYGYERVTKTFDSKCACSGRSYEYLCPSFAFAPDKNTMDSSYRISDEHLAFLNSLLAQYLGTHNFHNFTSGKHPSDKSANRYITKCEAKKPFECRAHEFIAIGITGQSFMIHQIRKMIGLCIAICRGFCSKEHIEAAWGFNKLDIPRAPGLGLLLERVEYQQYNEKYGNDGLHNPLTWQDVELEVERFKIECIWQSIMEEEIKKSPMVIWLKTLANHTYSTVGMNQPQDTGYKGQKGVFPTNVPNSNNKRGRGTYRGHKRPWESGPRGGGRGGRGGRGGWNNNNNRGGANK
eukprot:TCONS_00008751-protein